MPSWIMIMEPGDDCHVYQYCTTIIMEATVAVQKRSAHQRCPYGDAARSQRRFTTCPVTTTVFIHPACTLLRMSKPAVILDSLCAIATTRECAP